MDYATVTNVKERQDQETAQEVMDQLKSEHIDFENGDGKLSFDYLEDARWNIFVMSKDSTNDPAFLRQYQAAMTESINDNQVQVIPILTKDTTINDIPEKYRWTIVLESSKPDFLKKLSTTMDGKFIKRLYIFSPLIIKNKKGKFIKEPKIFISLKMRCYLSV